MYSIMEQYMCIVFLLFGKVDFHFGPSLLLAVFALLDLAGSITFHVLVIKPLNAPFLK